MTSVRLSVKRRFSNVTRGFVDGTDRGFAAQTFRLFANFVSVPYSLAIRFRNLLFDLGFLREISAARPAISVGNITLGGVGKTPFVAWLTRYCLDRGLAPGLISRGYKSAKQKRSDGNLAFEGELNDRLYSGELNDEARELALRFPTTPHYLGSNRALVAETLLARRPDVDVLIFDDAHQHRRLARDLNVVLIDALNPFGGERVVPSGFLREPLSGLKRANVVLLSRADMLSLNERETIRQKVLRFTTRAIWGEIAQIPQTVYWFDQSDLVRDANPQPRSRDYRSWLESEGTNRYVAFCGLGAPLGFRKTLDREGLSPTSFLTFPDHCAYEEDDYRRLEKEADRASADGFLTTTKDLVKLKQFARRSKRTLFALGIGVAFLSGQGEFERKIQEVLAKVGREKNAPAT